MHFPFYIRYLLAQDIKKEIDKIFSGYNEQFFNTTMGTGNQKMMI